MNRLPPVVTEWALRRCLPPGLERDSIVGDLREEYLLDAEKAGPFRARMRHLRKSLSIALRFTGRPSPARGTMPGHPHHPTAPPTRPKDPMNAVFHDLRSAVRLLVRRPGLTLVAILSLGLGIGASTAIFTLVDTVLLKPLPYPDADELLEVFRIDERVTGMNPTPERVSGLFAVPYEVHRDWLETSRVFSVGGGYAGTTVRLATDDGLQSIQGARMTSGAFETLRVQPEMGRVFLHATGQKGSGPGEFEDIFWLVRTRGDSLLAYDWRNRRVSVLSPDGEFVRHFILTVLTTSGGFPVVADPFPDGDLLLATDMFLTRAENEEGAQRDSAMYYVIHPDGTRWDTLGAFPGGESYQANDGENWVGGGLVFGKFGYAGVAGEGFYYGSSDDYEIELRDKVGRIQRLLRLEHENLPVTRTDIDTYVSDRLARARDERRRQIYQTMFERMPFPQTMPAYEGFIVDLDGNLWVAETTRPGDDQPRWRVFDPEGVYLGMVETPLRFTIFEIGRDYLLGRGRDELEVDHLVMYELRKGS